MKRSMTNLLILLLITVLAIANWYILSDLQDIRIRPEVRNSEIAESDQMPPPTTVRIGVISRFAPNIIFNGYQPIMDYLNANSSYHFELRLSTSYQDAVDKLQRREVSASFLGAWIYGHLTTATDLVPLAAPRNSQGESAFRAVLISRFDSSLSSPRDLSGARVALPSAESWSGNWLQVAGLPAVGLTVADLDSLHHFDHHQTVVWEVLRGHFSAGVVKESVAASYRREGLRTIALSMPIPGPPLVAHRDGPREILATLSELLLKLDPDHPADRAILAGWTPEFAHGFLPVTAEDYAEAFGSLEAGQ